MRIGIVLLLHPLLVVNVDIRYKVRWKFIVGSKKKAHYSELFLILFVVYCQYISFGYDLIGENVQQNTLCFV